MKTIYNILFIFLLLQWSDFSAQSIRLLEDGKVDFQIVIPKAKTEIEWLAAFQLKKYIDKSTGKNIPVVYDYEPGKTKEILVGKTNRSHSLNIPQLQKDDVAIITKANKIYLTGGDRKGVCYAASTFLEDYFGVRKFAKDFERIPFFNGNVLIPNGVYRVEKPTFDFRNVYFLDANDRDYADWHKLNYSFEDRVNYVHSFNQYLPNALFKNHPEYFALVNGKRTAVQPCLSHPDVYKIMKTNLMKEMGKNPNQKVWSISQTDNEIYCHCDLCEPRHKAGNGFVETLMPFVNRFAKDFPDKTISTLAYRQSIHPSKFVKPLPNVEIMLCYTHLNRAIPISTGPQNAKMFRDITDSWLRQTQNIFVWDYEVNYMNTLSPFPNFSVLQPNIQYFSDKNLKKVFIEGTGYQKSEFNELKCYLIAKLLWNPDIDLLKIQNEFIDAFYGPAAPEIKEYIAAMENEVSKSNAVVDVWADPVLNKDNFLSSDNINKYRQILNRGLAKVKNTLYYDRVLKEKLSVDYAEIKIADASQERKNKMGNITTFNRTVDEFVNSTKRIGVDLLKNAEYSPDDFSKDIKKVK